MRINYNQLIELRESFLKDHGACNNCAEYVECPQCHECGYCKELQEAVYPTRVEDSECYAYEPDADLMHELADYLYNAEEYIRP